MSLVWEYQIDGEDGCGWKGWRVTVLMGDESPRVFAFDERDGVRSPEQAIERTLAEPEFEEAEAGSLLFGVTPIRTLVSAEINPN